MSAMHIARWFVFVLLLLSSVGLLGIGAQAASSQEAETATVTAPVVLDGRALFQVRGVSGVTAAERAEHIAERIESIGASEDFAIESIRVVRSEDEVAVMTDGELLVRVFEADAALEHVDRYTLATARAERIRRALQSYRFERSSERLQKAVLYAIGGLVAYVGALVSALYAMRRLTSFVEDKVKQRVRSVAIQSFQILKAQHVWQSVQSILRFTRVILILALTYAFLEFTLALFPWTRAASESLFHYVMEPLSAMVKAFIHHLPNLLFLVVLFLLTRYGLRMLRLFFDAVERGAVRLDNFEPEWSRPTYRLIRTGIVVLALVVAYPYIPGSSSDAFKGISIFLGVLLSIGSSSFTSNLIAGYALSYRRAFRAGDRVSIDGVVGDVLYTRMQVTHLRSLKNEEIVIPNSTILNNTIVNYSSLARSKGLIIHTTLGIGYEVPWRQVEAMLLVAASRTDGVLQEPRPFVLQKALADFAVTYELNAYCSDPQLMFAQKNELHRNILDVFNEYGVQIMTPAYESDPPQPKLVPKEQWFSAPAKAPERAFAAA
jgi:small-conductance mechanosensitive channel